MIEDLILEKLQTPRDDELPDEIIQKKIVYLDHAAAPLPLKSLISEISADLLRHFYGNSHSSHQSANRSKACMTEVRELTLKHFGLSYTDYDVIFTSNSSKALNLVGEIFPFDDKRSFYMYSMNAHNSLSGIRAFAKKWGCFSSNVLFGNEQSNQVDLSMLQPTVKAIKSTIPSANQEIVYHLLAAPGECNFSGKKINYARAEMLLQSLNEETKGDDCSTQSTNPRHQFLWLLDAAKSAASSRVDLSSKARKPEFITLSYYKIFGFMTGLGALIVKRDIMHLLRRRYLGGGTLLSGAADSNFLVSKSTSTHEYYEDGTPNIHGIVAAKHGFSLLQRLGGMDAIEIFTQRLHAHLFAGMRALQHRNGTPLCIFYSESASELQGPTIAFNLQYPDQSPVSFTDLQRLADAHHIQLRTGCFCNLGACQENLELSAEEMQSNFLRGKQCAYHHRNNSSDDDSDAEEIFDVIDGKFTGACRVSLSFSSTQSDCDQFLAFLREHYLDKPTARAIDFLRQRTAEVAQSHQRNNASVEEFFLQKKIFALSSAATKCVEDSSAGDDDPGAVRLEAIYVYPIKSCAGVRVDNWPVPAGAGQGLLFDRMFAIVEESASMSRVLTMKQLPILALLQPKFKLLARDLLVLEVRCPALEEPLVIPLAGETHRLTDTTSEEAQRVRVCGRMTSARRCATNANEWISRAIHAMERRTATQSSALSGEMKRYALVRTSTSTSTSAAVKNFANSADFLLLSIESMISLSQMIAANDQLGADAREITIENFRPNIVISTRKADAELDLSAAHAEDNFAELILPTAGARDNALRLVVSGPCARCSMVNVNYRHGVMSCRAFEALASYRKHRSQVYFGQFLSKAQSDSEINDCADPLRLEDILRLPRLKANSIGHAVLRDVYIEDKLDNAVESK